MIIDNNLVAINNSFINNLLRHTISSAETASTTKNIIRLEIPDPIHGYDISSNKWISIDSRTLLKLDIEYIITISELLINSEDKSLCYVQYYRNNEYDKAISFVSKMYPMLFYRTPYIVKKSKTCIQSLANINGYPYASIRLNASGAYEYGMAINEIIDYIVGVQNDINIHIRLLTELKNKIFDYEHTYGVCKILEKIKNDISEHINELPLSDEDRLLYALNGLV